ncbi:MAG TPA: DNA-processing protein DprA [Spirochaetota bacterium]|nr:DNA-processing protein DprA [Spirochaetota bacterium]
MSGTERDILCAIALSVSSSPAGNDLWEAPSFPDASSAWEALAGGDRLVTQAYITARYSPRPIQAAEQILKVCRKKSIRVDTCWDARYPKLLKEISRPPLVLYAQGGTAVENSIAIVGTRKADPGARETARRIASELASSGFSVVSGMAVGVDREAHEGALSGGGMTVGVLANGIDIFYPAANSDLYRMILADGRSTLLSEYPPGIMAGRWTFARRNRIISGLSLGTVVVKAGTKSGALITARYALEQNREVFACPGPAFDESYFGCNGLIREGAQIVSSTEDIVSQFSAATAGAARVPVDSAPARDEDDSIGPLEREILGLLGGDSADIDALVRSSGQDAASVNETLVLLELSGKIIRAGTRVERLKTGPTT